MPAFLAFLPGLFTSKLGQYAMIALAIFLALAGLYWKGHSDGYAACDAAHQAAAVAEAKRETKVDATAVADSQKQTAEDKKADDANAEHVDAAVKKIEAELPPETVTTVTGPKIIKEMPNVAVASLADTVCVPADVADELRNLR